MRSSKRLLMSAMIATMMATFSLVGASAWAQDASQNSAPSTDSARKIIAEAQAIAPGGIDELKTVELGGIPQWISVRGNNPDNPILLFIHGGPGSPMMPESWIFQRPWEDFFTVVQWDQRGAGKTFGAADGKPDPTMTLDKMQADAEQLIDHLRQQYGKKKIFLVGHSFGTVLALRIAQHRPDALYAYIGIGQVVNVHDNETEGYRETLAEAKAEGNQEAIAELSALAPYPSADGSLPPLMSIATERKWDVKLGGMRYGRSSDPETAFRSLSPAYSDEDVKMASMGEGSSAMILLPQLGSIDFNSYTKYQCPIYFFAGAADRTTPTVLVENYYRHIHAPAKKLFKIERASHDVVFDAPGEVLVDLVQDIRPLAHRNEK
jgi:pimeloyl-ACP methyl ester carboxylesterase